MLRTIYQMPRKDREITEGKLEGLRILLAEDFYLIARSTQLLIEREGGEVLGPAPSLQEATELAMSEPVDAAIIDLNLRGELTFPLIRSLRESNIGVVIITGYTEVPEFKDMSVPVLHKPVRPNELIHEIKQAAKR